MAWILVCALGGFLIIQNALVAMSCFRGERGSAVPVIGAALLAVGMSASPHEPLQRFFWIAFLIDYGSAPGLVHLAWRKLSAKRVDEEPEP